MAQQHCSLSEKQIEALLKNIAKHIASSKNSGKKFDPEDYMRKLYSDVASKRTPAEAMDYVSQVPRLIMTVHNLNEELADYLDENTSLDSVNKLRKQFKTAEGISAFVGIQKTGIQDAITEVIEEKIPTSTVIPTEVYTNIENTNKSKTPTFTAFPFSALATFEQEAKTYDGLKAEDNIVDDDPHKQLYYKLVRLLNNAIGINVNADNVKIGNTKGIFLKLVKASTIPIDKLYIEEQKYLNRDDSAGTFPNNNSVEKKLAKRDQSDVYLVFSDRDGNILYFDNEANITTEEAGGKFLYTKLRTPFTPKKDNPEKGYKAGVRTIAGVQSVDDIIKKKTGTPEELARQREEMEFVRQAELDILEASRNYVVNNPGKSLMFSVRAGNNGYILEDYSNPIKISSLNIPGGFLPTCSSTEAGGKEKGGVYFTIPGFQRSILIYRPKFSEVSGLTEALANILFGENFENFEKVKILKQFFNSKDINVYENSAGQLAYKENDVESLVVPENKEAFINALNNQVVNIDKSLLNNFFTNVKFENGKAVTFKESYNKFISDNFHVYLQPNAQGDILLLNAYNKIDPTPETFDKLNEKLLGEKEKQPVAKLEQQTPTDDSLADFKEKLGKINFSLKKAMGISSEASEQQIKKAKSWFENHPIFKNKIVEFEPLFHIFNSDAVAEFNLSSIRLFKGANYTDLYHESWHVFSQMFLSLEDKQKLYGELRNLSGSFTNKKGETVKFSEATDFDIEEFIAEDFRKYVLSDGKVILKDRKARNNIFSKIYNFLKAIFNGYSYKQALIDQELVGIVKEMYDKLHIGDINQYKPSLNNVQFSILNKGIQTLDAKENENKGLSYEDSSLLVESIDSLVSSLLKKAEMSLSTVFIKPEVMNLVYDQVRKQLEDIKNKTQDEDNLRILNFALENWGSYNDVVDGLKNGVIAYHKKRSSYINFEDKYAELIPEEQNEVDDNNPEEASSIEDALNNKSQQELREEFGEKVFEKSGTEKSVYELASGEVIYLIKSLPAVDKNNKPILNKLGIQKLADFTSTWGKVINTVEGASDITDMYNKLLKASRVYPELGELATRLGDPSLKTQPSDWPYVKMWLAFFRDMSVYRINIKELRVINDNMNFDVEFTESSPGFLQVKRNFISQFESNKSKYIDRKEEGTFLNLNQLKKDFLSSNMEMDKQISFLRAIGLTVTDNSAVRIALNKYSTGFTYLYNDIFDQKILNVFTNRKISGRVNDICEIESKYSGKYSNNSVENVNGDKEFDLSLNNTITQTLKGLNDNSKDYSADEKSNRTGIIQLPHLAHLNYKTNPAAKYGILLNSMFEIPTDPSKVSHISNIFKRKVDKKGEPVKIQIINLNGIKNVIQGITQYSVGGIKTNQLDVNSKFIMDVHTMLKEGVMELPRHASKSSSYGAKASKISTEFNQNATHLYISSGHFATDAGMNHAADLMKGKLAAEMERIAIVKKGLTPNIPGFNQRGLEFTIFDDILDNTLKSRLKEKADDKDSMSVIESDEFRDEVASQIKNYFEKLYLENLAFFNQMRFLSKDIINSTRALANKDAGVKNISDYDATNLAIKSFTVNAFIHNTEMFALFYGDLAMYNHLKEEFNKRNAAIGSTGRIFSTDPVIYEFINNLNKSGSTWAKRLNVEQKDFNGILNTSVFKDLKLKSVYYEEYLNSLIESGRTKEEAEKMLKPYTDMTVGDGQGWITFDAYRTLSILEHNWSNDQNELYNKIVNDEKVDPADVAEFFPPRKFQYSGPLQTDMLHLQAFHKFSLAPLIPSVIKGSKIETLHNNMVKQNIHYGLFESGSKLATITENGSFDTFYDEQGNVKPWNEGDKEYTKNKIFLEYLKNQVDINSHWKNKTIFSTQLRGLIINDLFLHGVPKSPELENLVLRFEKLLNDYQDQKKEELLKEMGWKKDSNGNPIGNVESLVKFVRKEFSRLELSDHTLDFIDLDTKSKLLKNDLSLSLEAEKVEKLLSAIVIKRLIRQKINGEQLVQLSTAGFESVTPFRNATEEELKKYKGTTDLPTYRPGKVKSAEDIYKLLGSGTVSKNVKIVDNPNKYLPEQEKGEAIVAYKGAKMPNSFFNPFSVRTNKSTKENVIDFIDFVLNSKDPQAKWIREQIKSEKFKNKPIYYGNTRAAKANEVAHSTALDYLINHPEVLNSSKTSAMKVKVALKGDFYKLLKLKHNDGKEIETRDRLNEMIKNDEWLDKGNNRKMITMTGVRIPVQGLNSMEFMEVYEFLPEEAGNILIPPAEIVAKSGGDFDIDKLTIFIPNIGSDINKKSINKESIQRLKEKYPSLDFTKDNINIILDAAENNFQDYQLTDNEMKVYKVLEAEFSSPFYHTKGTKGTENKIIENIREILEHPDNFESLIRPNNTDEVKGVADRLAKENIQGYNPLERKDGTIGENISPTRCLEPMYNLYKHESNNIGKRSLGIAAVDNKYSSIMKRVGAYLENSYTKYTTDEFGNVKMKNGIPIKNIRPVNIRMDHNRITIDGKEHISLSGIDTVTKQRISNLISQLMNGWVDIEKDAWIFNLNGNTIAGPVMLFLLETGVDFETAAHFVSQPLIVDYIKERFKINSPFYAAAGGLYEKNKNLRAYKVKLQFFKNNGLGSYLKTNRENGNEYLSGVEMFNAIDKYNSGRTYTTESLKRVIEEKDRTSNEAIAGLLHFMELEEMIKQLTGIKLTLNPDTKPTKSLFSVQEMQQKIQDLDRVDIINQNIQDKIKYKSPISSFFIQAFQLSILKPLMSLRGSAKINNFLINKTKGFSQSEAFKDKEKLVSAFHNDFALFILQNYIKNIDINTLTEYQGLPINKAMEVKNVMLRNGAFVKDGVMYIDPKQIREDFESGAYANDSYTERGLHKLSSKMFSMTNNKDINIKEYSHFVLEREYLRSITPVSEGQSREQYEEDIAKRALRKTFNFYYNLKSEDSIANEFLNLKLKYPKLVKNFSIFDELIVPDVKEDKAFKTLKFRSGRMDVDLINTLHENLVNLSDFSKIKVEDPIENREISNFFNRLILFEYLRTGITKGQDSLATILPHDNIMKLYKEPIERLKEDASITDSMLQKYYMLFEKAWMNKNLKNKFRNYISEQAFSLSGDILKPGGQTEISQQELQKYAGNLKQVADNVMTYKNFEKDSEIKDFLLKNSDILFIYPSNEKGIRQNATRSYDASSNSFGFSIKNSPTEVWTDATYEENVKKIDNIISDLINHIENGTSIAFPENGLVDANFIKNAPRTYDYLIQKLYSDLKYVHPGADKNLGFRELYQSSQDISDREVEDFIKKCFGE